MRRFADAIGRPSFAGTPFPDGKVADATQLHMELGATGTPLFGGFLRGVDPNPDMDGLTAVKNLDIMRKSDAQVAASLRVIMQPIRAADVGIDAASDDPEDKEVADFVQWALLSGEKILWDDFLRQALLMIVFGYYLFEKVWTTEDDGRWAGKLCLARLAPRPPQTVWQWFTDEDGALLSIKQLAVKAGTFQFLDIPGDKLVRFTYDQEGDNFAGTSILRSAYPHWLIKNQLYVIDAIRAQRYGCGIPRAKIAKDATVDEDDKAGLIQTLMGMSSHQFSYIIQPYGVEVDILTPTGTQGGSAILPSINHHNEQITRNVLASFLDMGGKSMGGSNALGSSSMDFFNGALQAVGNQIEGVINKQIIAPLVDANFEVRSYPTFRFSGIRQKDLKGLAAMIASLSQAGMTFSDMPTENTLRDMMDLPQREDEGAGADDGPVAPGGAPGPKGTKGKPPPKPPTASSAGTATVARTEAPGVHPATTAASGPAKAASNVRGVGVAASKVLTPGEPGSQPEQAGAPPNGASRETSDVESEGGGRFVTIDELRAIGREALARERAAQPVADPSVVVPANQHEQSARSAIEPTAAQAAETTAAVDHTESARTDASGVVPARSTAWDGVAAVPTQPRTTDTPEPARSIGVPASAHMARSTTIASSGDADEEGALSTEARSSRSRQPNAAISTRPPGLAMTETRTPTSRTSTPASAAEPSRSMASLGDRTSPVAPTEPTATTSRATKRSKPDRSTPEDPTIFWRAPTPIEARILDLREMPRRLQSERDALLGTLRGVREAQLLRIASAVAHAPKGVKPPPPLVGKIVADVLKATKAVYAYGRATVASELARQRSQLAGRRLGDVAFAKDAHGHGSEKRGEETGRSEKEPGKFSGSAAIVKKSPTEPSEHHVTFPDGRQYSIYKDASSSTGKWEPVGLENSTASGAAFTKPEMLDHLGKIDESRPYVDKHSGRADGKTIRDHLASVRARTKFRTMADWDESKHPREKGRFSSAEAKAMVSDHAKDGFISISKFAGRATTNLGAAVEARADSGHVREFDPATEPWSSEQEVVGADKVAAMLTKPDETHPSMVPQFARDAATGKLVATDGNHRLVAAAIAGKKIKVNVVTVKFPKGAKFADWDESKHTRGEHGKFGPVFAIKESKEEKSQREKRGFTNVVRVNATDLKARLEKDMGEPLAWNPKRAEAIRSYPEVTGHPLVHIDPLGHVGVSDGRHRIAVAAERGQQIDVALRPGQRLPIGTARRHSDLVLADATDLPFAVNLAPPYDGNDIDPAKIVDLAPVEIPIANLIATQASLTQTRILPPGTPVTFPIVVEAGGQRYIYDGHKRLSAAKANGDETARVRIVVVPVAFELQDPPHVGDDSAVLDHLEASAQIAVESMSDKLVSMATEEAISLRRSGWDPDEIEQALGIYLGDLSESDISKIANREVNEAFALGRHAAAEDSKDEIERAIYSALMDRNTCDVCASFDGQEFEVDSDEYNEVLPPNPGCEGGDACRCSFIYVLKEKGDDASGESDSDE